MDLLIMPIYSTFPNGFRDVYLQFFLNLMIIYQKVSNILLYKNVIYITYFLFLNTKW